MRIILCENYDEISKAAAKIVAGQVAVKPDSVLGLATGSTPVGTYRILVDMNKRGEVDFKEVKSFNLDEYYPIAPDNNQSYRYFMNENLFNHINIEIKNTHVLNGLAENPEEECAAYEKMIEEAGGIDLQILGICENGHIGFNEPDRELVAKTHLTKLTESTINANSRFFSSIDEVPTQSLTMGMASILSAKKIILLASGANKRNAVKGLVDGGITTSNPASLLNIHPDVVLICDREAYGE